MRALAIAHLPEDSPGRIAERLVQRGLAVDTHVVTTDPRRPDDAAPFPEIAAYDLVVPMGSIHSLTRKHEISSWVHDELALVRQAHERGTPVLGICFGGQLIADALGGAVDVAPVTEIGWYELRDGDLPNPVGPGPWLEWHHDRFTPPPGADVLARTEHADQLIRIGRTVGTQFHPEVDVAHVANFLAGVSDASLAAYGTSRERMLAEARHHEAHNIAQCHALVDWFLDEVAFPTGFAADQALIAGR